MRPALLFLACAFALSGAAFAQEAPDAPLPTAGSKAGGAPTDTALPEVARTPAAPQSQPQPQPLTDELMAAADAGRRAPLLGEFHGSVGAVVGTGGLRGAYGHINAQPSDNVTLDLRFSTLHSHGYPYGGIYPYGGVYGPGSYADPLYPYRRTPGGWTTEVLGPDGDVSEPETPSGR